MNEIDWVQVFFQSKDVIQGMAIIIRFGIISVLAFLGISMLVSFFISRRKKKDKPQQRTPGSRKFLIALPIIIIAVGLAYSYYETVRDPYALHGKIVEKYLKGTRKIESVRIEVTKAHFFSEKGQGKDIKDKTGLHYVRVTPGLYVRIKPGSETVLLVAADDRGYGQILEGDVQITGY